MRSAVSPTVLCQPIGTLASSSARARNAKLVSSVRPLRTSLPMVMISTCMAVRGLGTLGRRSAGQSVAGAPEAQAGAGR